MIGVQFFGLRKELSKDHTGTLKQLKEIGFEAVEPMIRLKNKRLSGNKASWTLGTLTDDYTNVQKMGFKVPSVHISLGLFGTKRDKLSRALRKIKEQTGISNFVFSGMFSNAKGAKKWGRLLHRVAEDVKEQGCHILYHNHESEFTMIEISGKCLTALDYFYQFAGPEVMLQLDIGWAGFAGDELEAARKYKDRIVEIHCKDFFEGVKENYNCYNMPGEMFAPIGEGVIKTREFLGMRDLFPHFNGAVIIDQDRSAGDIMEDVRIGFRNLEEYL